MRILDLGSGDEVHFDSVGNDVVHVDLNKDSYCLELLVDGYSLPFGDDVFDIVHCSHVLEHVDNPLLFLREICRVSKFKVVVKVPNSSFYRYFTASKDHIYGWSSFNLENLLLRVFKRVCVSGDYRIRGGKLDTLKVYVLGFFLRGSNELVGECFVR